MKKNLLSVLILFLMLVNIAMSVVVMTSVTGTNKKTAELIDSIAMAMNLELYTPGDEPSVPLSDSKAYAVGSENGKMTVLLAKSVSEDGSAGKDIYIVFDISLLMNTKHEEYANYNDGDLSEYDSRIVAEIERVVGSHTEEECRMYFTEDIREEILKAIQNLFRSVFIYNITLSNVKYGGS